MGNNQLTKSTALSKLFDRLGNPLEWSFVNKTLLLLSVELIVNGPFTLWNWWTLYHPQILPSYLLSGAIRGTLYHQFVVMTIYIFMTVYTLWLRKKELDSRLLAYLLAFIIALHGSLFFVALGYATNPLTFLALFLQAFIGYLLFDRHYMAIILVTWTVTIGLQFLGEQFGVLSYAPSLSTPPFGEGEIDGYWQFWNMGTGIVATALMLIISIYIIARWKERETKVNELSQFLRRMFGRYLSPEVMSSLLEDPSLLELGGERKQVTIVITDLRGFTALSERLKPEQVVQLLNCYFEIMVETVLKYNGTIDQIRGDSLLVIFGAPQNMKDQAERAIACSIDMQNAMVAVNNQNRSEGLPELEMGIGINKSEVIVGNIGSSKRSKYTVVGSGVNIASRIESYTVGGQILISESVYKESVNKLHIEGEQEVYPKGSKTPLRIYEVGGIAGPYYTFLDVKDSELVKLQNRIPFHCSFISEKHIEQDLLPGRIISLSDRRAEAEMDISVDLLSNIKICLISVKDELSAKNIYGKIIEQTDKKNYVIRFTSVPPEITSYFHAFRMHALK